MEGGGDTKVIQLASQRTRRGHLPSDEPQQTVHYYGKDYMLMTGPRGGKYIVVQGKRVYL